MARTMLVGTPDFVKIWKDEIVQGTHKWWFKNGKKTMNDVRFMKEPLISSLPIYKARKASTRLTHDMALDLLEDNQVLFIHNAETESGIKIKIFTFLTKDIFLVISENYSNGNEIVLLTNSMDYYCDWGLKGLYYAVKNEIALKQDNYVIEKMFLNPTVDLIRETGAILPLLYAL